MNKEPTIITLGGQITCPRCQAINRQGTQCKKPAMQGKRVCRNHGGASSGAKTPEGKKRRDSARLVHGRETRVLRDIRKHNLRQLRELEAVMAEIGMI